MAQKRIERFRKVDYNSIFNDLQSKRNTLPPKIPIQAEIYARTSYIPPAVVHFGHLSRILIMRYTCKAEQTQKQTKEEENAHFQFHSNLYFRLPIVLGREVENNLSPVYGAIHTQIYLCCVFAQQLCVCVSAFLKSDIEIKCEK